MNRRRYVWAEELTDIKDARRKVAAFIQRFRHEWILERHGYRTPAQVLEQDVEQAA